MSNEPLKTGEQLPEMFVPKEISGVRMDNFFKNSPSKYEALKNSSGYPEKSYTYSSAAMHSLFHDINRPDGVRVHFARYSKCGSSPVPAGLHPGELMLLFAPEKKRSDPPDTYYFLNNDVKDNQIYSAKKDCAEVWIRQFMEEDEVRLRGTIDPQDPDNADPDVPEKFSDTKSVFYTQIQIEDAFMKENLIAHVRNGSKYLTTAYKVSFSAYGPEGNGRSEQPIYKKRLFIQFDYMYDSKNGKEVYYLDDMDGFSDRPYPKHVIIKGLDNGQLCPTHCP